MTMSKILKYIAGGFLLITFHLNIQTVDLLPDWIGYLLIFLAIKEIGGYGVEHGKLDIILLVFTIYHLLCWVLNIFGVSYDFSLIGIVFSFVRVYADYGILSCVGDLCVQNENEYAVQIFKYRDIYLILDIIYTVLYLLIVLFASEVLAVIGLILGIVLIVVRIITIVYLFKASKS